MAIMLDARRTKWGSKSTISWDDPLLDRTMTTSFGPMHPKSPWSASLG
jgi:hypothetical protein